MVSYKKKDKQYDNSVTNCTHRNKVCSFVSQSSLVMLPPLFYIKMKLNKQRWVIEERNSQKTSFFLEIDTMMPSGTYLDWIAFAEWQNLTEELVHNVFYTSESFRPKKRKDIEGVSGSGTYSVAIVQVNHKAGQLLSAGKGRLLSIYRELFHASQSFLDHKHKSITRDVFCHTLLCTQLLFSPSVRTNPMYQEFTKQVVSQNIWPWTTGTHHLPSDTSE